MALLNPLTCSRGSPPQILRSADRAYPDISPSYWGLKAAGWSGAWGNRLLERESFPSCDPYGSLREKTWVQPLPLVVGDDHLVKA